MCSSTSHHVARLLDVDVFGVHLSCACLIQGQIQVTFLEPTQPSVAPTVCSPSVKIICADVKAVSWEPLCCDIRQLTCRLDCLTFSGWLRLSTLIYTRLSEMSGGTATLTPGIIYHAQEACLPCRRDTFPLRGQPVTFIGG